MNAIKIQHQTSEEKILDLIPDLRNVLLEKHNLGIPERHNDFLARCLRVKDGNLEEAVKLALVFPKLCSELVSWNISLTPSFYKSSYYDLFELFPLAVRDSENRRIFIIQQGQWDTSQLTCNEVLWAGGLVLEYAVSHSLEDQRNGFVAVWDFSGFALNHLYAVNFRSLLAMAKLGTNGAAGRVKGGHFLNAPKPVRLMYSALKPFLKNKFKKRIHFHDNLSSLASSLVVDAKYLPKILGGDREIEECIDKQFMQDLLNSDAFFEDMFKHGFPTK